MKHVITFILLFLCIPVFAQQKIAREYIEWSDIWIPGANKTDLPHVLLIGNSITRGYYGKVEEALKEKACRTAFQFEKCRRSGFNRRTGSDTQKHQVRCYPFQ